MSGVNFYSLEDAAEQASFQTGIQHSINTILSKAEQGIIAICFRAYCPDSKKNETYFLDSRAIKHLKSIGQDEECDIEFVYFDEESACQANNKLFFDKKPPNHLNTDEQILLRSIRKDEILITSSELSKLTASSQNSDKSIDVNSISENYFYLDTACEELSRRTGTPINPARLFELAEKGAIAIAFSPEPTLGQRMYAPQSAKKKRFLYLSHSDISMFSPHGKNLNSLDKATAFKDADFARSYNLQGSTHDIKSAPEKNQRSASTLFCENIGRNELVVTKAELERFIKEHKQSVTPEYCSYHDAGHILFSNDSITPRMREHELEMWCYIDQDNLQLYLDKELSQKTNTKECRRLGLKIESCYFSRTKVESFNPESQLNSGRWLTFQEVLERWSKLAKQHSLESINNLITSVHDRTIATNHLELWPLSPDENFYAVDPYTDVADTPQSGMFQQRQIEVFEKHHFQEILSALSNPEPIGYEIAFQILKTKFGCSAEEFTVWCNWDRWDLKPYMDDKLKRPCSFNRGEISSLSDCLIGTFFNRMQVEQYEPDERYITYSVLVNKIMAASGYDKTRVEQLVANKFDQDREKSAKPSPIFNENTLGMTWTTNFKNPCPQNAAFEVDKVNRFIALSFSNHPVHATDSLPATPNTDTIAPCQPIPEPRVNQLHQLLIHIDEELEKELGKRPSCKDIQKALESRHEQYDNENIIQEIDEDNIYWKSKYGREQTLKFSSLAATISTVRGRKLKAKR